VHVRARLDEQLRALLEHDQVAREGQDPEGVHQMRVSVRRMRAALKAEGSALGDTGATLQAELSWLGGALGPVRDLDVQLDHLRGQTADFEPDERAAAERLLSGLLADYRHARSQMLAALSSQRYADLLAAIATATRTEVDEKGEVPGPRNGDVSGTKEPPADLVGLIGRPFRKLSKAVAALGEDPPDDDLHTLRIRGKRLRYAAELAGAAGDKQVRQLIRATKELQDVLGEHQDAVVAEGEVRRLLSELGDPVEADVAFVAGRLVERERARKAICRSRWRPAFATIETHALTILG
jgi:CHAD domain-containing protein